MREHADAPLQLGAEALDQPPAARRNRCHRSDKPCGNPSWISTLRRIPPHRIRKVMDLLRAKGKYRFSFGKFENKCDTGRPGVVGRTDERRYHFAFPTLIRTMQRRRDQPSLAWSRRESPASPLKAGMGDDLNAPLFLSRRRKAAWATDMRDLRLQGNTSLKMAANRAHSMSIIPDAIPLRHMTAAWLIAAFVLLFALVFHLLPGLLAGLLVYEMVRIVASRLRMLNAGLGRVAAVALLALVVILLFTLLFLGAVEFFGSDAGSLPVLLQKMAEIIESSRGVLPSWVFESMPVDADGLKNAISAWLRSHASDVQLLGSEAGRTVVHILIGVVIGALVALRARRPVDSNGPLVRALAERAVRLSGAFRRIVFAQVRIAALNTLFTASYLVVVLPLLGIHLPLTKTIIAITFVAGMLPVIGNLISNTVVVVVSLSASLYVALGSLAFLVLLHKLEYFLNARIVGAQIQASAWELLLAMLIMEAAFGIPGLVAAPIYYAYLKDELATQGLI
jgi:predicted PurR-regulated permease PerM